MHKCLIVVAHPDDEVLGCGGTIAGHTDVGDSVQVLIVAEGATARQRVRDRSSAGVELKQLGKAAENAASTLGVKSVDFLEFPDNRLDSVDLLDIVKAIEDRLSRFKPDVVYTHHSGDLNIDHQRVHQAVITACRPIPGRSVKRLLSFEVLSSTEWQSASSPGPFQPNWFVDISEHLERKLDALLAYQSELRPWPHARSKEAVEHLARLRGAMLGVRAAEAFMLLRELR